MNCTCFDLTLEQAANGGLMQAAVNCTHKGVMSIDEKLEKIVMANWGGANITEQVAQIKQVFSEEASIQDLWFKPNQMTGTEWLERFENELSNLPTSHPKLDNIHRESDIIQAARKASKL